MYLQLLYIKKMVRTRLFRAHRVLRQSRVKRREGGSSPKVSQLRLGGLEAFSMNNTRSRLVVFIFRDPHILEGGQA
jgi:hypothetical protein